MKKGGKRREREREKTMVKHRNEPVGDGIPVGMLMKG